MYCEVWTFFYHVSSTRRTLRRLHVRVSFDRVHLSADFNECKGWGYCDQFCTNTDGSFECFCKVGYQLNGTFCRAEDSAKLRLYYAYQTKVCAEGGCRQTRDRCRLDRGGEDAD